VRTTLVIDDDLYRRVKAKAAVEGRKVTALVEEGLRAALSLDPPGGGGHGRSQRVRLPLVSARRESRRLLAGMTQAEIHERLARLQLEDDRAHAAPLD
jgi:hypothetical protein